MTWEWPGNSCDTQLQGRNWPYQINLNGNRKKVFVFLIQWDTCMRQVCSMYHLHELHISIKIATLNALELDAFFSREHSTVLSSLRVLCSLRCLCCKLRYLCLSLKLLIVLWVTLLIVIMKGEKCKQTTHPYLSFYFWQIISLCKFFSCHTSQLLLHFKPPNFKFYF